MLPVITNKNGWANTSRKGLNQRRWACLFDKSSYHIQMKTCLIYVILHAFDLVGNFSSLMTNLINKYTCEQSFISVFEHSLSCE